MFWSFGAVYISRGDESTYLYAYVGSVFDIVVLRAPRGQIYTESNSMLWNIHSNVEVSYVLSLTYFLVPYYFYYWS